jgi:hypothetical protein
MAMAEFSFAAVDFKRGLTVAKIVKPETGDYCFQFSATHLTIFSYDKRRYTCSNIYPAALRDVPDNFLSDEFYLTADRLALFDTDLDEIIIKVNPKSFSIKVSGSGQSRRTTLKKRSLKARRPPVPKNSLSDPWKVDRQAFEQLLYQVSCSAQVKETKTEEDMRINQVHFYPDDNCAVSNARFYGSVAFMDGIHLDLSVVSADIPAIRTFCSKAEDSQVHLFQDEKKLFVLDPSTDSIMAVSRVSSSRPKLTLPDSSEFGTTVLIDRGQLFKNLEWASIAIEGTQRLGVKIDKESLQAEFYFGHDRISQFTVEHVDGKNIDTDLPVKFFLSIVRFMEKKVMLRYHHASIPTILEITEKAEEAEESVGVKSVHYLQSMRAR